MLNRDKSIKARMDFKLAKALEAEGLINLVPSVSEVGKFADGEGAFGSGAAWGRSQTIEAYTELLAASQGATPDALTALAVAKMNKARDTGSELHDAFHKIRTGELKDPTPAQAEFAALCEREVKAYGIGEYQTEVQFADEDLGYGGTSDLTGRIMEGGLLTTAAGMDWKTVSKPTRETRKSELLQIGAYAAHFGWQRARICYVLQDPIRVVGYEDFDRARLDVCYKAFTVALELATVIEGL
jgi:hypothetical protein